LSASGSGSKFDVGLVAATTSGNRYMPDNALWYFLWTFAKEVDYAEEHCNNAKTVATPDALDKGYSAWVCTNWMGANVYSVIEA
jgi:hypothetical protein